MKVYTLKTSRVKLKSYKLFFFKSIKIKNSQKNLQKTLCCVSIKADTYFLFFIEKAYEESSKI